ncbi:hypothetical protein [uncultured Prochlorococcus sp.]|uniref:hypothetical protein n=1 Tax=uncultured Prochlorococcus sp. TaxID=159733 RepID=UPI00258DBF84|nr:hypothetical protein [uncultured Prochlorococcus sp.]
MKIYDSIVIGTGPCSEPVLFHLSKTNISCLVLDSGDINKNSNNYKNISNFKIKQKLTPKQRLNQFNILDQNNFKKIHSSLYLRCRKYFYIYALKSGGLSNSWGGGAFEWPSNEIKKTTSLPYKAIQKSYYSIKKRLLIKKRINFAKQSELSLRLLSKKNNKIDYQSSKFFLEKDFKNKKINYPFNQNLIWNSKNTVYKYIKSSSNIEYKKNTTVLYLNKRKNQVWELCCQHKEEIFFIRTKSLILCSGTLNSACLAFSATNIKKLKLKFKHNNVHLVPLFTLKNKISCLTKFNLELPELSWKEKNIKSYDDYDLSSGYYVNSLFLMKEFLNRFRFFNKNYLFKIISFLLSRFGFFTIFLPSTYSNVSLELIKSSNYKNKILIYATITNKTTKKSLRKKKSEIISKLFSSLPKNTFFINIFAKAVSPGGDIHYSSTLPDEIGEKTFLNTSSIGEINKLPMIFVADPSRLAYLSSLPHTFTVMAINDASMPKIIKKILSQ